MFHQYHVCIQLSETEQKFYEWSWEDLARNFLTLLCLLLWMKELQRTNPHIISSFSFSQQQKYLMQDLAFSYNEISRALGGLWFSPLKWYGEIWVIPIRIVPALSNSLALHWYFLCPGGKQKRGLILMYKHSFLIYYL